MLLFSRWEKIDLKAVSLQVGVLAGAGRIAVKLLGESRRLPALAELFANVGESRELVELAKVGERVDLVGWGVEEGKEMEQLSSHGESCSKLGGECDSTGVVALPGGIIM